MKIKRCVLVDFGGGTTMLKKAFMEQYKETVKLLYICDSNLGSNTSWLNTDGVKVYIGNDAYNRTCWQVKEAVFDNLGYHPANDWYMLHLELDGNGKATATGTTLNGKDVASNIVVWNMGTWSSGTADWTNMAYFRMVTMQASGSDVVTVYMDKFIIGGISLTTNPNEDITDNDRYNVCVLRDFRRDELGPRIVAAKTAADYSGFAEFYDKNFNLLDSYSTSNNDAFMGVTCGDPSGDGTTEIALVGRKTDAGVYIVKWNNSTQAIEELWNYQTSTNRFWRGVAIGNFAANTGLEVVFGSEYGDIYLLDKNGSLIDTRVLDGGMCAQVIRKCNLDVDSYDEMIIATGRAPGRVYAIDYNNTDHDFSTFWMTNVTADSNTGNNSYGVAYHPQGNPFEGPAIAVTTEAEGSSPMGSVLLLDISGNILWRQIITPERTAGVDFIDVTGDGRPEIFARAAANESYERIYDNYGNLLLKKQVGLMFGSGSGPFVYDFNYDWTLDLLLGGTISTAGWGSGEAIMHYEFE